MTDLVGFLYQQSSQNTQLAAQLTLLELPNLPALLEQQRATVPAEQLIDLAGSLEQLFADLGRPQALVRVVAIREQAAQALGEWSNARFRAERLSIERRLDSGDCLRALGRLDEAAAAHEEAIRRAEKREDFRATAVSKLQLGTV